MSKNVPGRTLKEGGKFSQAKLQASPISMHKKRGSKISKASEKSKQEPQSKMMIDNVFGQFKLLDAFNILRKWRVHCIKEDQIAQQKRERELAMKRVRQIRNAKRQRNLTNVYTQLNSRRVSQNWLDNIITSRPNNTTNRKSSSMGGSDFLSP